MGNGLATPEHSVETVRPSEHESEGKEDETEAVKNEYHSHDESHELSPVTSSNNEESYQVSDTAKCNVESIQRSFSSCILFSVNDVKRIERNLNKSEKISLSFLFFDDPKDSLDACEQYADLQDPLCLLHFAEKNSPQYWSMKLLECIFYVKNFSLLNMFGVSRYDGLKCIFSTSSVAKRRKTLYLICDALSHSEAALVMDSVPHISNKGHLEIFFLKVNELDHWKIIKEVLARFGDPITNYVQKDFDPVIIDDSCKLQSNLLEEQIVYEDNYYEIKDPRNVGVCLIINQMVFEDLSTRAGSEKDAEALESTMKDFNFTLLTVNNKSLRFFGTELAPLIHHTFKENHSIFFMVILSHGMEGTIYSSDDQPVSIEKHIIRILQCVPKLRNIPKVLVIQACQGDKFLLSRKIAIDGPEAHEVNVNTKVPAASILEGIGDYISDAFIAMSTVPGFKSFRQPESGTYFIQTLCQCLKKYPNESFFDIITRVINLVNSEVVKTKFDKLFFAQQPECRSILKKKLFLKPPKT